MREICFYLFIIFMFQACRNAYEAPVPDLTWELFENPNAVYLNHQAINNIEGIYNISESVFLEALPLLKVAM